MAVKSGITETDLTKGQLRKLNALRKSVGPVIGERALVEWLKKANPQGDRNVNLIAEAVQGVLKEKRLSIPRGGYLVRRVRGWVLVERADT